MPRHLLTLLLLAPLLLPVLPAQAAPPPTGSDPARRPERFFGAVQAIFNPTRAEQAGVQWERLIFPWSLIQKDGPGSWSKGYFDDDQIQQEVERGMEVVGVALYTPQWASSTPTAAKPTNVPANLYLPFDDPRNFWGQFMYKLAARYRGLIQSWIIWNEPDMYSDAIRFTWDGSVEDLYQLIKVAWLAVKKANPDARVILPGMTYWWDKEGGRELYLQRLLDVAAKDPSAPAHGWYFDAANLHLYGNPLSVFAATRVFQRTLAQYGLSKPIWITEANVIPYDDPLSPLSPIPCRASMDQQASYMIQAFALARAAGVERMSIYKLVDEAPEGQGDLYGLVRNDGSVRPAFTAYRTAVQYLAAPSSAVYTWDGSADPPTDDQVTALLNSNAHLSQWVWPAAVNRVTLERGDQRITVAWNASPNPAQLRMAASAKSAVVINKFGVITGELVARDGQYTLDLPPSSNNTDPRHPNLYLVGGDPQIIVEQVAPIPEAVDAPIQVVWPKDGSGPADASSANVSAVLLLPGTLQPAPCRWNPAVRLMASIDGGPARMVASGARRLVTDSGVTYPVWDFNNVDVSAARQGKTIELWLEVDGAKENAPHWVYAAGAPQPPFWQQKPTTSCQ